MTVPIQSRFHRLVLLVAVVVAFAFPQSANAFHFPWDQGHDTFQPNPPDDDDNPPGDDDGDDDGDPVELLTGNFLYSQTRHDIQITDDGPTLELLFTYHSQDRHNGPFGRGWHTTLTSMAVSVTDGQADHVIIRRGNGRRKRYEVAEDGTINNPSRVYDRLTQNVDGTYTLTFKGGRVEHYGADGRITGIEGIGAGQIVVTYDSTGAIASANSANGLSLIFTKGANGKISTVTDSMSGDFQFGYTGDNLTSVTDPIGNVTAYGYDAQDRLERITAPGGLVEVVNVYDSQNRVAQQTLPQGLVEFFYDSSTRTRVRDSVRGTITHNFNFLGLPTVTSFPDGTEITKVYDASFNLMSITDRQNRTTTFTYDAQGNIASQTDPSGDVLTFTYEPVFDRVSSVVDMGDGTTATLTYDDVQRSIQVTDVSGSSQTIPSDSFGVLNAGFRALGDTPPVTSRYPLLQK